MGGAAVPEIGDHKKIKGGNWTVVKFFTLSVAYTSVWLAVSSELGYYRFLYGPQVLLYLNIAYYAPSIPLLILSSFFDEDLEAALGTAKTILVRLLVGLVGYGLVCAWFPFMPQHLWFLLCSVVALGLFSSIAFSASYQMVARFANKNTIALGLGCSASGPLILILQIALGLESIPTFEQQVALFLIIAVIVASGLWATVSLLFRHWDAIESSAHAGDTGVTGAEARQQLTAPFLGNGAVHNSEGDAEAGAGAGALEGEEFTFATPVGASRELEGGSPRTTAATPSQLYKTPSLPPLIAYNLLEPYETFLSAREDWTPSPILRRASSQGGERRRSREGSPSFGSGLFNDGSGCDAESPSFSPAEDAAGSGNDLEGIVDDFSDIEIEELSSVHTLKATISDVWPALIVVGLQGGIALTLFPFFTYLPSSGWIGVEALPKALFFVRIFSDILGRILPRSRYFKPNSIRPVMIIALIKLATEPLFFFYLKSNPKWHSDIAAVVYIAFMWSAGGYVNTTAYMVAPRMVRPQFKGTAAGLMAMTYQLGHFIGLALAAVLARVMYGGMDGAGDV
ncbi:hypothetical protein Ndes2526B_g05622 [Nannochloris sp. 'desiccata']|nr:hypothetical protein NADE_005554 [Chlorella desiccata (nom. nud.)]